MELEALESLFPMELRKESDSSFKLVGLVPFTDNSETNHVSIDLQFSFPPTYPMEGSIAWSILRTTGCIATDSSRVSSLEKAIRSVIEDNPGCCVVYQIAERVQEWLRANNEEEKSLHDMMVTTKTLRKEERFIRRDMSDEDSYDEEDDSDYSGSDDYSNDEEDEDDDLEEEEEYEELQMKELCAEEDRVTREEFVEWKKEYDEYLLSNGLIKRIAPDDNRKSGKEQFLELLVNRRKGGDTGNVDDAFNAELFQNEDDLDDIELDDEEAD